MDKRTVAAVVAIVLIIILMQTPWFKDQTRVKEEPVEQRDIADKPEPKTEIPQPESILRPEQVIGLISLEEIESKEVIVESDLFMGAIDTRGGLLRQWAIKPKRKKPADQEWVKLVPGETQEGGLSLLFTGAGQDIDLDELVFQCHQDSLKLSSLQPEGSLLLTAQTAEGVSITKEFTFHNNEHKMGLRIKIEGAGQLADGQQYALWWKSGLPVTEGKRSDDLRSFAAHSMLGDMVEKSTFSGKVIKDSSFAGDTKWFAVQSKYFLMAMVPPDEVPGLGVEIRGRYQKENKDQGLQEKRIISGGITMPLRGGRCDHSWEIYLGPIDYFTLKEYGIGLEKVVYLGRSVLRWIGLIILHFFVRLHGLIANYGVVIILFSIIVKGIFYPLTRKSITSIRKMQEIQPEIKKLQEKYKKEPAKLQRATMDLYRKNKVSPLSGCFPMLLQMPVFFALYAVFRNTIELRGSSFLWIKDLSAPDTVFKLPWDIPIYGNSFNILPFVMAITMFIQQKISMRDPKQAYMIYMMPLFLFFIFNNISSGLVLYWTMFNVLHILQERLHVQRQETPDQPEKE
ncbi:membrane protein insertase YidC [Candidatus Zixiibacteriota bacterium]